MPMLSSVGRRWGRRAAAGLFLLLTPALAAARSAREEATREFSRTVTMRSGQAFRLEHQQGDVVIRTHPLAEARILAHIRVSAPSAAEASSAAQQVSIEVQETPGAVAVRTRYPEAHFGGRGNVSYAVDYEITLPETAPLQARNSFGDVSVSGLKAEADVRNAHGRLTFTDGRGRPRLENSFGAVEVRHVEGDVVITNQNGAVRVAEVQGALQVSNRFAEVEARAIRNGVTIVNTNGNVLLADAGGPSRITSSFGKVEASLVHGDLAVSNGNGAVEVRNVAGAADLRTSFGRVDVAQVQGAATVANSNGDVTVRDVAGAAEVRTSFGRIEVRGAPKGVRVVGGNGEVAVSDVGPAYLKTSFGTVQAERVGGSLEVENSNGAVRASGVKGPATVRTSFAGVVLGGVEGPVIDVRNQNGAVEVEAVGHRPCTSITLATSFGPIRVRLPANGGYDLVARTSFGSIQSELPVTASGSLGPDALSGRIGAGGCALGLTDSNGTIEILRSGPAR
jgi:DUF4097 and DUF4098 domain-containing protein YvlB